MLKKEFIKLTLKELKELLPDIAIYSMPKLGIANHRVYFLRLCALLDPNTNIISYNYAEEYVPMPMIDIYHYLDVGRTTFKALAINLAAVNALNTFRRHGRNYYIMNPIYANRNIELLDNKVVKNIFYTTKTIEEINKENKTYEWNGQKLRTISY